MSSRGEALEAGVARLAHAMASKSAAAGRGSNFVDRGDQLLGVEFDEVAGEPRAARCLVLSRVPSANRDQRCLREAPFPHLAGELAAVDFGHLDIGDDQIELFAPLETRERLPGTFETLHAESSASRAVVTNWRKKTESSSTMIRTFLISVSS